MAFKPNYNFQKAERDRAKQAKKDVKARERQERKAAEETQGAGGNPAPDSPAADASHVPTPDADAPDASE